MFLIHFKRVSLTLERDDTTIRFEEKKKLVKSNKQNLFTFEVIQVGFQCFFSLNIHKHMVLYQPLLHLRPGLFSQYNLKCQLEWMSPLTADPKEF